MVFERGVAYERTVLSRSPMAAARTTNSRGLSGRDTIMPSILCFKVLTLYFTT